MTNRSVRIYAYMGSAAAEVAAGAVTLTLRCAGRPRSGVGGGNHRGLAVAPTFCAPYLPQLQRHIASRIGLLAASSSLSQALSASVSSPLRAPCARLARSVTASRGRSCALAVGRSSVASCVWSYQGTPVSFASPGSREGGGSPIGRLHG